MEHSSTAVNVIILDGWDIKGWDADPDTLIDPQDDNVESSTALDDGDGWATHPEA